MLGFRKIEKLFMNAQLSLALPDLFAVQRLIYPIWKLPPLEIDRGGRQLVVTDEIGTENEHARFIEPAQRVSGAK